MKLSIAANLGDTLRSRRYDRFLELQADGSWCGCAIGGAQLAAGYSGCNSSTGNSLAAHSHMFKTWPWLLDCGVDPNSTGLNDQYVWIISRIFRDIFKGDSNWTFEKMIDYIASVEPECGECNQFTCTCTKEEIKEEACVSQLQCS